MSGGPTSRGLGHLESPRCGPLWNIGRERGGPARVLMGKPMRTKWDLDLRAFPCPRVRERPPSPALCACSLASGPFLTLRCEASVRRYVQFPLRRLACARPRTKGARPPTARVPTECEGRHCEGSPGRWCGASHCEPAHARLPGDPSLESSPQKAFCFRIGDALFSWWPRCACSHAPVCEASLPPSSLRALPLAPHARSLLPAHAQGPTPGRAPRPTRQRQGAHCEGSHVRGLAKRLAAVRFEPASPLPQSAPLPAPPTVLP